MKLYLALNKYLSSDSLLAGNSRRSLGFISVNAKSKRKSELTSPSSTCTQANACAYAQTPGLAFCNRRTSHESCAGKLSRLAVPGQTYFCMDVPHSTFKDFITPSQVQKNITHLIFVIHGVTCYSKCISSCDYRRNHLL